MNKKTFIIIKNNTCYISAGEIIYFLTEDIGGAYLLRLGFLNKKNELTLSYDDKQSRDSDLEHICKSLGKI